jgi:hypothetical protein
MNEFSVTIRIQVSIYQIYSGKTHLYITETQKTKSEIESNTRIMRGRLGHDENTCGI